MLNLYFADLRLPLFSRRKGLLLKLESVKQKDEDIREWNKSSKYLAGVPPGDAA